MWPMGQLPGTSANKSDPVVTEEVKCGGCDQHTKELRSTVSPRPPGGAHAGTDDTGHSNADSRGHTVLLLLYFGNQF